MEESHVLSRFVALVKRELSAVEVTVVDGPVPADEACLAAELADGRQVVARFSEPPAGRDALTRRLEMLASTFADALVPSERSRAARPPVAISLHEELRAVAARAQAVDVAVIDAHSPVVWGCASSPTSPRPHRPPRLRDVSDDDAANDAYAPESRPVGSPPPPEASGQQLPQARESSEVVRELPPPSSHRPSRPVPAAPDRTARAIAHVRGLDGALGLARGRHLRHVERDGEFYLAISFSGIYVLVFVFDGPFDELRAERTAHESLPRIEGLVAALPPLDPEPQPMGGVVALRRPRRR